MKRIVKILAIGILTTFCRILGQLFIPAGSQTVLEPSIFARTGTMPLAFTLYGILAYSVIASLFFLIQGRMTGHKIWQGIKYGLLCSAVWTVYLLEPLPHVAPLDRMTYPLVDSLALIVMGLLLGIFFAKTRVTQRKEPKQSNGLALVLITCSFLVGRLIGYMVFDLYASFQDKQIETLLWCIVTGFIVALVMQYFSRHVNTNNRFKRAFTLGAMLFGLDLLFFNFFMPLVFQADIVDLILRTAIDVVAVTLACLSFGSREHLDREEVQA